MANIYRFKNVFFDELKSSSTSLREPLHSAVLHATASKKTYKTTLKPLNSIPTQMLTREKIQMKLTHWRALHNLMP
jgi:hypothetical protein